MVRLNNVPTVDNTVADNATAVEVEQDLIVDEVNLSNVLRMVNDNEGDYVASFPNMLREFSDNCVRALLELIGGEPVRSAVKNIEKVLEWINCNPTEKRKYWFLKKDDLVNACVLEL